MRIHAIRCIKTNGATLSSGTVLPKTLTMPSDEGKISF